MLSIVILTLIDYLTSIYLRLFLSLLIRISLSIIVKFLINSLRLELLIIETKSLMRRIAFYYLLKL